MFKNQHRKLLFFSFLIFLGAFLIWFSSFILAQGADWYRVTKNGGSETIDKHAICWIVTNNRTDYDVFVPVKNLAEWQAFIDSIQNESYPENVTLSPCVATCPVCHSGTPPSCVSETTNWGENLYGCEGYNRRCFEGDCKTCEANDGFSYGYIFSDGCNNCAEQGGLACWRKETGANEYTCDELCSLGNYEGCVQADWNDSDWCRVANHMSGGLVDACIGFNDGQIEECCIYTEDHYEGYFPIIRDPATVPVVDGINWEWFQRSPIHNPQNCGDNWPCRLRICVCQY